MAKHATYTCGGGCPVEATLDLIDGKWKGVLLFHLQNGTQRFNALKRNLPNITQRMLTKQLRELEASGLVVRTVYAEVPPRVEYSLTPLGESLKPIIGALKHWGEGYLQRAAESESSPRRNVRSLSAQKMKPEPRIARAARR
jgi:DNA-binding HxlR family transcriptional regulator